MRRFPIAGSVSGAATQIVGLLEQQDESELKKMSVVFCTFGADSGAAWGFEEFLHPTEPRERRAEEVVKEALGWVKGLRRGKPFFLPDGSTNLVASLNLNLNEWACAIGRVQLRKLPRLIDRGAKVAARLAEGVQGLRAVSVPPVLSGSKPNYWFLRLRVHAGSITCDKVAFCDALLAETDMPEDKKALVAKRKAELEARG